MWFGTRQQLAKLNLDDLANKFPSYTFSATARDFGVLLDQELTFAPHLHSRSRDCYYQLRQLRLLQIIAVITILFRIYYFLGKCGFSQVTKLKRHDTK